MAFEMNLNDATLLVFLCVWPLWLAWELVILWKRRPGTPTKPKTISMVSKDYGRRLSSIVYIWGGMASHWWVPAKAFAPLWMQILFWLLAGALLALDVMLWRWPVEEWPQWVRLARTPLLWLGVGFLAGRFLFPQVAP